MRYMATGLTDKGRRKKVNQDTVLILKIGKQKEDVLAVVCDGMGGLDKGELASREAVKAFLNWSRLSYMELEDREIPEEFEDLLYESWESLLQQIHRKVYLYGKKNRIRIGTTVTAMLFRDENYYIAHVGDSRGYEVTKKGERRLTQDQTLADIMGGKYEKDSNVLIQGLGASDTIRPVYQSGKVKRTAVYLLCSDGLGNKIEDEEFSRYLKETEKPDIQILEKAGKALIKEARRRGEGDDISILLIQRSLDSTGNRI